MVKFLFCFLALGEIAFGQAFTASDRAFIGVVSSPASAPALTQPTFVRAATNSGNSASSITLAGFDCSGGNYAAIAVAVKSSLLRNVNTITCNGSSASKLVETNTISGTGKVYIWGIASPTTGDVVVTFSGAPNSGYAVAVMLFNHVGSVGAAAADANTSLRAAVSVSPNTASTDLVVDALGYQQIANNFTAGGSQTVRAFKEAGSGLASLFASSKPASAGSTTMGWSVDGTGAIMSQLAIVLGGQ